MLVLTRKVGERIVIGGEIAVSVEAIVGSRVRIGIEAPRHIDIRREELPARPDAVTADGTSSAARP